jgi:predicted Ser/Thr protein kinase
MKHFVFKGAISGQDAFIKISDGVRGFKMLENECTIAYPKLAHLQGKFIPKLLFHGVCKGQYIMATSCCGKQLERCQLTAEIMYTLQYTLGQVHKHMLYGSVKIRNVVVDENGHPFLIDFERAELNAHNIRRKVEMCELYPFRSV